MLLTLGHVPERLGLRKWMTMTTIAVIIVIVVLHEQLVIFCFVLLSILLWQAVRAWCQKVVPVRVVSVLYHILVKSYLNVMEKFSWTTSPEEARQNSDRKSSMVSGLIFAMGNSSQTFRIPMLAPSSRSRRTVA